MLGQFPHGPDPIWIGRGEGFQRRAHRLGLDVAQLVLGPVLGEIDAGPAGEQRQRRLVIAKAAVLLMLVMSLHLIRSGAPRRPGADRAIGRSAGSPGAAAAVS